MTSNRGSGDSGRRGFLRRSALAAGGALGLSPLGRLLAEAGTAQVGGLSEGFGRLRTVRDSNTGLPLLRLPAGFSYTTFGWAGEPLADGSPCPPAHDGMGVVASDGDVVTLVRNHEVVRRVGSCGPAASHYESGCSGGTVTLRFDCASGKLLSSWPSLSGTLQNCGGGVTPWGSWLSCEEIVADAGVVLPARDGPIRLERDHGYLFEVPAEGESNAKPLRAMGQFRHEAVACHRASGDFYLTEDAEPTAGFYRFVPSQQGKLSEGGQLFMLRAVDAPDLRSGIKTGQRWNVDWVPIERPDDGYEVGGGILGVQKQGLAQGASRFTRLEGCVSGDDEVFFTATNGGDTANGQVFCYYPKRKQLELIYESDDPAVLDYPDNVVLSPRGGLVICQDSKLGRQHLFGLARDGQLFAFARQNVVLDGAMGFSGDFRGAEWAGCCFSPDGRWLFANVYAPGFSVAITGPWKQGMI